MKNLKSIALATVVILTTAVTTAQTKINTTTSKIEWVGKKITGQHSGVVNFKEGTLTFKGKKLSGGSFVVDMTSLTATDLTGEYKEKLDGHLKADDFFGTEKFPSANLVFKTIAAKSANVYNVTADLTIKGITKPITFDFKVAGNTATADLKVDRTKYDIRYGSKSFFQSIGDKAINDDFDLSVVVKF